MAVLAFDVDGPLADFTAGLCRELTARGFKRTPEEIRHWSLHLALSDAEAALVDEILSTPGFCHGLPWMPGAQATLRYLRGRGHDVFCLTSPHDSPTWVAERLAWLAPVVAPADVVFAKSHRKHHVRADVLVEDHPGNAHAWLEAHPKSYALLVDRPWNRPGSSEFWPHSRMLRVRDNDELLQAIEAVT